MLKLKTDLGYLKSFTNLQAGKVEKQLEKLVRYGGKIYNYKEYICLRIIEGFNAPEVEENYSYYKKDGEKTKPKTLYMLSNDKGQYIEPNKTLFDFAKWLVDNNLMTEDRIVELDNIESLKLEEIKREEERIELEEKQKEEDVKRQKDQLEKEIEEKIKSYSNSNLLELAEKIHCDLYGEFIPRSARMILVLIENFDNKEYKEKAKKILHLGNPASRKIFEVATGLKLPRTERDTLTLLNSITSKDFLGIQEYKSRKKNENKEVKLEKFYQRKGTSLILEEGEKITHLGLNIYIKSDSEGYWAIEERTGNNLIQADSNKSRLIKSLKEKINSNNIEKLKNIINSTVEKFGSLPRIAQ